MPRANLLTAPDPGGPRRGRKVVQPLPAGQLPPEDSPLWQYPRKAIENAATHIQDDTREWAAEVCDNLLVVCREYPTHPRWQHRVTGKDETVQQYRINSNICAEVHMLARELAGKDRLPDWAWARLTIKQTQATTAARLMDVMRKDFAAHGAEALRDMRERAPNQYMKLITSVFAPKRTEHDITITHQQADTVIDPGQAERMIDLLKTELERRANATYIEAKIISDIDPLEHPGPDPEMLVHEQVTKAFAAAEAADDLRTAELKQIVAESPVPVPLPPIDWDE